MDDYIPTERPASPPRVFAAWNGPASKRPMPAGGPFRAGSPPLSPAGDTTFPRNNYNNNNNVINGGNQQRQQHKDQSPHGNSNGSAGSRNVAGKANWRPTAKLPASAKEQEAAQLRARKQAALAVPEPADYQVSRVTSTFYPSGDRRLDMGRAGNGGGGRYGVTQAQVTGSGEVAERFSGRSDPPSPLDDLLSHVNHLLADFDSKFG